MLMIDRPSSPPEVAKLLKVKPEVVRGWITSGLLQAVDLRAPNASRPAWKIFPEHLEAFLHKRSSENLQKPAPPRRRRRKAATADKQYY